MKAPRIDAKSNRARVDEFLTERAAHLSSMTTQAVLAGLMQTNPTEQAIAVCLLNALSLHLPHLTDAARKELIDAMRLTIAAAEGAPTTPATH